MAPITAPRMMDIHSNAAKLLPNPTLPNAAKITRMLIRRQKRNMTCVDLNSRGRFGSCANWKTPTIVRGLTEIVAADRLVERVRVAWHNGDACPARRRIDALGVDEGTQDRQRQIRVTGFDRSIEPIGKLALARQRAIPLTLVIGDAANLP